MQTAAATYDAVTKITLLFALVLALSFAIERVIEILKAAYDMLDSRFDLYHRWTRQAEKTAAYVERRLRIFEYVDEAAAAAFLRRFNMMLLGARDGYSGTVPILSGDLVRVVWVRIGTKAIGCAIGIILAFAFGLDVLAISSAPPVDAATGIMTVVPPPTITGQLVTGVILGLGSGIAHKIITTLERRQRRASGEAAAANG